MTNNIFSIIKVIDKGEVMKKIVALFLVFSLLIINFPIVTHANENTFQSQENLNFELLEKNTVIENDETIIVTKYRVDNRIIYFKINGNEIEIFDESLNSKGFANFGYIENSNGPIDYEKIVMSRSNVWDSYDYWHGYQKSQTLKIDLTAGEIADDLTQSMIAALVASALTTAGFSFSATIIAWAVQKSFVIIKEKKIVTINIMYNYNTQCRILRRESLNAEAGSAQGHQPNDPNRYQIYWTANPNDYTQPTACRILMRNPEYAY